MTDQSDPNVNRRDNKIDDTFYTRWIIGGGIGIAIIIAVLAILSTGENPDYLPRTNTAAPALAGSQLTPIAPASR